MTSPQEKKERIEDIPNLVPFACTTYTRKVFVKTDRGLRILNPKVHYRGEGSRVVLELAPSCDLKVGQRVVRIPVCAFAGSRLEFLMPHPYPWVLEPGEEPVDLLLSVGKCKARCCPATAA